MTIDDILGELVDHGFEDLDEDRALAVINETLGDAASREAWPQLQTSGFLTFDGTSVTPTAIPDDIGRVISVYDINKQGTIPRIRWDDRMEQSSHTLTTSLQPGRFWTQTSAGDIKVYGPPAAGSDIWVDYFRVPEEVSASTVEEDIWLPRQFHRGVIVNGAVYKLYLMEDDVELSREFERLYDKAIENMRNWMHLTNTEDDYIHVVDPADWDYD